MFNLGRVTDSEKLAGKLKAGSRHEDFLALVAFSTPLQSQTASKLEV